MAPGLLMQSQELEKSELQPEGTPNMMEAMQVVGVEHPEDTAGLTTSELAELLSPATFEEEELKQAIGEAQRQVRRTILSKEQRQHFLPYPNRMPAAAAHGESFWLARAAKQTKRKALEMLPAPLDILKAEGRKSAKAARKLLAIVGAPLRLSPARSDQLVSSLSQAQGPSCLHAAARACTRLQQFLLVNQKGAISLDNMPDPGAVKDFLDHQAKDGPTVPHDHWEGLAFCAQWLAAPLQMTDVVLAAFKAPRGRTK